MPVQVEFVSAGVKEAMRSFDSIEARATRFERALNTSSSTGARTRVTAAQREGKQVADAHVRATEQWTKQRQRIVDTSARTAAKMAEREAAAELRATEKAATAKLRVEEQFAKQRERIRDNSARMAGRLAEREAREEARVRARALSDRQHRASRLVGVAGSSLGGLVSRGAALATAGLAIGGGLSVADALRGELGADKAARALSNATYVPTSAGGLGKRVDRGVLMSQAKAIQAETNIDKATALAAAQNYIDLSSDSGVFTPGANGRSNFQELAKMAKAEGADVGEVFSAAGSLRAQNENLTPEQMMDTMRIVIGQGKLGAVSMRDLAGIAAKTTASSAMYQGDQTTAQRNLLGLSQIAMRTAGNPEEAATAVTRFGSDVMMHQKNLSSKYGISVADAKGRLKDPAEILADMMRKSGGNLATLHEMGLGDRSIKVAEAIAPIFNDAEANEKGSGYATVLKRVRQFESAGYTQGDVDTDFANVIQSDGEKLESAVNRIREVLAEKGLPYLERFVNYLPVLLPKVESFINATAKIADFLVENPWKGLGLLVAGTVTKDIAGAAIGEAVKGVLVRLLAGGAAGGVPGVGGGGGAAVAGGGAVAGAIAAAGVVAIASASNAVDATLTGQTGGQRRVGEIMSDINHLEDMDPKKREATVKALRQEIANAEQGPQYGMMGMMAKGVLSTGFGARVALDTVAGAVTGDKYGVTGSTQEIALAARNKELAESAVRLRLALDAAASSAVTHRNAQAESRMKSLASRGNGITQ